VHALTAGAGATILERAGLELMLGGQGTANAMDGDLKPYYGARPVSWELFLRLRPATKALAGHAGMHHHDGMAM
jgi:hypothetical protein